MKRLGIEAKGKNRRIYQLCLSRAFKEVYQQTPAAYRSAGSHNAFKQANLLQDASMFDVIIEPLSVTHCASVSYQGSYMQINQAMATLFAGAS